MPTPDDRPTGAEERDACGTGFVADRRGHKSHDVLTDALEAVCNLEHRGAVSPDGKSSDGAGVMTQLPVDLFDGVDGERLGLGMFFMPDDPLARRSIEQRVESELERLDLEPLRWRDVPFRADVLGEGQREAAPTVRQLLVHRPGSLAESDFERRLFLARRRVERAVDSDDFSVPSLSSRTVVYKGLVVPGLLPELYPDLADPDYRTAIAVFHQRFSTNTMPTWARAQPLRFLAHNGEINTLLGNINAMRARQPVLESQVFGEDLDDLLPVIPTDGSDSMALDAVLELLHHAGRDLLESMAMLIPEAYQNNPDVEADWRAFSRYHAAAMEPWDGPAALVFTDGQIAAAKVDRNGLRPLRYWISDRRVVAGSEAGIIEMAPDEVTDKGRLGPGEMFAVDTTTGEVLGAEAIRRRLADRQPYQDWNDEYACTARSVDAADAPSLFDEELARVQKSFGYGKEHPGQLLEPIVFEAKEPIGSMGDDTPLAVLSEKPQRLFHYFRQRFAQVTNPPIDSLRERSVMSLKTRLSLGGTLLEKTPEGAEFIEFDSPVITTGELAWLEWSAGILPSPPLERDGDRLEEPPTAYRRLEGLVERFDTRFPADEGREGFDEAVARLRRQTARAVEDGARLLILSDRGVDADRAALPSLLATATVHHHLIEEGLRTRTAIVCDTGDALADHDFACLLGYGAMLIHPRVAYESVAEVAQNTRKRDPISIDRAQKNYRKVIEKGILKIMAKLGISDVSSYRGAQTFEILGLDGQLVDRHFTGTASRIGGATLGDVADDVLRMHADGFDGKARLEELGIFRFRRGGEYHAFNPMVFKKLHRAVKSEDFDLFREYADEVDHRPPATLRDLLRWGSADEPVPLAEVEPVEEIVRRFTTQAMSFGSLSREAHETLAVAMNRLGAKSNSGEGGEEADRFDRYETDRPDRSAADWHPSEGDWGNSAIKQIASGRFGVTPRYLTSARQLEIKMAQGSKPGEGGQIPGHKVTEAIARTRRSTPGVTLISPPPHHDIYSIEDLAQLIYDLKRVNQRATVCVKLVSLVGVGTIAAGVAKGFADAIQISGHDGGTGASPLGSLKHAGLPWELGLADAHQTLVAEGLRGRVKLRVDGGLKTGRDVAIAAMLGAEEFGFGTAALVASGCVMARQCHANTCPVGVATQDDKLRARFPGEPDRVIAFMSFLAEHLRHIMADLGVRSVDELVGRNDLLEVKPALPDRARRVDTELLLRDPDPTGSRDRRQTVERNDRPATETPLDQTLLETVGDLDAIDEPTTHTFEINNRQRSVGARLAGELARQKIELDEGTLQLVFRGVAGQSFGAYCHPGMRLVLEGEAQDYVGKGMAGGHIVIRPADDSRLEAADNVILGNTVLYGATGGRLFAAGQAGERLAVRNSGATAVVEGCGDHGCEYMTGGTVVILGPTGLNFAAGMSGGRAFVWDPDGHLDDRLNRSMATTGRVDEETGDELRHLVEDYAAQTGSARARQLLADWSSTLSEFRLVHPADAVGASSETPSASSQG